MGHVTQALPFDPQNWLLVPALQVLELASQHPVEQLVVVQTHDPLLHSLPGGHDVQVPPPVPQNSFVPPPLHVLVAGSQHPIEQLAAVQTHEPF